MNHHPHLKTLNTLYTEEVQPFRKVHRMIDLFESIIKSHTVVIIAEYVQHNQLSDTVKGLLAQGLRTPSLGTWQLFSRVLFEELRAVNYAWKLNEFASGFEFLDKSLNSDKTNVIAFRNGYAHGATPSDEQCENDIRKFEPYLNKLLSLSWIEQSSIEVNDGIVYVQSEANSLCCHPIFLFRDENNEASFAFFNDLKNDKIGLLNYPLGKHYREKEFFKVFHEYLPLNEWKKSGNNEFYQRIEELTETFKGRTFEREKLLQFVINETKGYCSIQGNPGIGKSALIAQFFKDLCGSDKAKNVNVVEYFIRRGTAQAQTEYLLNYLIKRTDELFPQGKEVRAEGKMVFEIQQQLYNKWRLWAEHSNGKKLLFLIDGLDEGVENNIVSYLPRENFQDILIIYGSRPGGHKTIDELWATLPIESHAKIELSGLSKEDIRALIYEVANKYDLERESEWIEVVQQRSQGNPLYLKLLCDSIENGGIALNDLNALPSKIDEYYKAILLRYAQDPDGDALLAGLYTFAAAKDYLTMAHLGLMNQLGDATLERIGSTLKEVLYENPLTENILDYQLFHESFREYLVKEKTLKVNEAKQRIIEFCGRWKELEGQWEQRYVLEHYASHLHEGIKEHHSGLLLKLIYDADFQTTQKKVLRGFESTNALFRLALLRASDLKRFDEQLEAGLCLVDLKYEEANDAPQIVAMVANGEIDLALKRIESFGGSDKEGMQRKFILYMLCLMELTLLESKNKPFRKEGIERLLNHLDEHIPRDTSLINWNDFFPSNLMFKIASELAHLDLNYLVIYKRTGRGRVNSIAGYGPYDKIQFKMLITIARGISDDYCRSIALKDISVEQSKLGQVEESLAITGEISDDYSKNGALNDIAVELSKQGQVEESLAIARGISDDRRKTSALKDIAEELSKQGLVAESASVMQELLAIARDICDDYSKSGALKDIAEELSKQGQVEESASLMQESLAVARGISDDYWKSIALKYIAEELSKQGQVEESASVMQESLANARGISDDQSKSRALKDITLELSKQGQVEESLVIARGISNDGQKTQALQGIAVELSKQGKVLASLTIARGISDDYWKSIALKDIAVELSKQGQLEESLAIAREISDDNSKSGALKDIAEELNKQGQVAESASVMQESLSIAQGISYVMPKTKALRDISEELSKQGQVAESASVMQASLAIVRGSRHGHWKISPLKDIAVELSKQRKAASLTIAREISDDYSKSIALRSIAAELIKQGQVEESASLMQESLAVARGISDDYWKSNALKDIAVELSKQGQLVESLAIARGISDDNSKSGALKDIAVELSKQGMVVESASVMQESLSIARGMSDDHSKRSALKDIAVGLSKLGQMEESLAIALVLKDSFWKSKALNDIAVELSKQGQVEESLSIARGISDYRRKTSALKDIAEELSKQGQVAESASVMQESLVIARGISDDREKCSALKDISVELSKQAKYSHAESIGLEISRSGQRQECWQNIAAAFVESENWQKGIETVTQFQSEEARYFYFQGWVGAVKFTDVTNDCINKALPVLVADSATIEELLRKYAISEIALGLPTVERTGRFNRALNMHWLLDIIDQSTKPTNQNARNSNNIDKWLHEIADEDDREQIELWAKQVAKGKISEEEFGERVREL